MADDQKGLRDASTPDAGSASEEVAESTVSWRAAKSGRITFEDGHGRVRFGETGAAPIRAIAIPLIVGARVVGALEARHTEAVTTSARAVEVLEMLAVHAATAIESARLNQVSEERSQVDPLTRLNNRRRLEEDLDAECKRCARYGRPLAFVMLDVDHFKAFNDAHGHPQADVALQELALVISGAVRTTDSAYRYGGEEFCVLLRSIDLVGAAALAERIRSLIQGLAVVHDGRTIPVTASIGCSSRVELTEPSASGLVGLADRRLYLAKAAGRNRVVAEG